MSAEKSESDMKQGVEGAVNQELTYWQEFRVHFRPLLAATLGLSAGMSLAAFVNSLFGPYLLDAFEWSKAAFALLGLLSFLTIVVIPVCGRLTDIFGVRRVALVGIVAYPASCLMLSAMNGDIRVFYGILVFQIVVCCTTTSSVYCRVIAEKFVRGRGLALAIGVSGPAVASALGSPLLTAYIDSNGWQAGYYALATYSAIAGGLAFMLLSPAPKPGSDGGGGKRRARKDYGTIFTTPAFWIILVGSILCSMPHALSYSQLKVMLLDHGVTTTQSGFMVSVFAIGVVAGRFVCGVALDRFATYLVAMVVMGLPAMGMFILASGTPSIYLLVFAVAMLGLSFGGEGDILAYFAARYFPMAIYSSVLGLFSASVGFAIAAGSGLLSLTLSLFDSFVVYTSVGGVGVLIGAANFFRLRRIDLAIIREGV